MLVTFRISIVLKGIHTKLESWTPSTVLCLHSVTTVWQKSIPLFGNPDVQILLSKAHPPKPSLCSANKYHVTSIKANSSRPLLLDCSRVSPISPPGPSVWLQEGRGFIFGEIFKIQNFWDSLDCTNYIKLLYIYINYRVLNLLGCHILVHLLLATVSSCLFLQQAYTLSVLQILWNKAQDLLLDIFSRLAQKPNSARFCQVGVFITASSLSAATRDVARPQAIAVSWNCWWRSSAVLLARPKGIECSARWLQEGHGH